MSKLTGSGRRSKRCESLDNSARIATAVDGPRQWTPVPGERLPECEIRPKAVVRVRDLSGLRFRWRSRSLDLPTVRMSSTLCRLVLPRRRAEPVRITRVDVDLGAYNSSGLFGVRSGPAGSYRGFGALLALLTVPHRVSNCHKKTGRLGFEMSLYIVQEFLGVLLVLAGLMGTILFFGIAVILVQEGIRQLLHRAKTRVMPFEGLSAKDQWLDSAGVDPPSAEGVQIRLARLK